MNENKTATPDAAHHPAQTALENLHPAFAKKPQRNAETFAMNADESIITPTHLAEVLALYRAIVSHEGDTATAPPLQASYMVALIEYANAQTQRADALQNELDEMARYERMKMNHNGGGADGSY